MKTKPKGLRRLWVTQIFGSVLTLFGALVQWICVSDENYRGALFGLGVSLCGVLIFVYSVRAARTIGDSKEVKE